MVLDSLPYFYDISDDDMVFIKLHSRITLVVFALCATVPPLLAVAGCYFLWFIARFNKVLYGHHVVFRSYFLITYIALAVIMGASMMTSGYYLYLNY